tara:strand:- start:2299 stop:3204 length:906 start_codon:yes stop_codon:yes gene_type:complete
MLLFILVPTLSVASGLEIKDLTQNFDRFWSENQHLKNSSLVFKKFNHEIVPLFPEFYQNRVLTWKRSGRNPENVFFEKFKNYKEIRKKILLVRSKLPLFLKKAERSFRKEFPALPRDIKVHMIHSLGEMDGGTRVYKGKFFFIFGVDSIAKYHKSMEYERKAPFLHHELFHVYHRSFFQENETLLDGLWAEGLAVRAAHKLNPSASWAALSLDNPKGLIKKCESLRARLNQDVLKRLKSPSRQDYDTYFYGDSTHDWIPKRSGYYLGYQIAKEANASISLSELARYSKQKILKTIQKILKP